MRPLLQALVDLSVLGVGVRMVTDDTMVLAALMAALAIYLSAHCLLEHLEPYIIEGLLQKSSVSVLKQDSQIL